MRLRRPLAALLSLALAVPTVLVATVPASAAASDLFLSEYVEGSGFNKAIEVFNGTGAEVDLAAEGYTLELYSNGAAAPSQTVMLTGVIADGGVHVVSRADADPAIVAQTDQLAPAVANWNGDDAIALRHDGAAIDVLGQIGVDPGTEWGSGLTSTADNTIRRKSSVATGDPDGSDAFDPAVEWDGYATNTFDGLGAHTFDGGGGNAPVAVTCGTALSTVVGSPAGREVTATDADGTVTDLDITGVTPVPAAGSISRTAFTPAGAVGGTATATVTVDGSVPAGSYAVELTATNEDGTPQSASCTLTVTVQPVRTIGEVQGPVPDDADGATIQSPFAGQQVVVRAVVTQKTLARSSSGSLQNGFYLQDATGTADGDPTTSDGIFVFLGGFTTLLRADGGPAYLPQVGDELLLRGTVTEFFALTQLTSPRLLSVERTGLDPDADVAVTEADPPVELADANRYWERHEGMRIRVPAGSLATSGRDVFASTADSEVWLIRGDDPLAQRADPFARRVFRDAHPLDDQPMPLFDNGNGNRIMIAGLGVKATTGDSTALLPPARLFDTLTQDAVGGLYFTFEKFAVQVESAAFAPGADPSTNAPPQPADRDRELAVSVYNVENLYDFRDDPTDGCDFAGNTGCPGVRPPFDYVPGSQAEYDERLLAIAEQITQDLHSPDLLLTQEAEDQDICRVTDGALTCDAGDGKPDTLQELALAIGAAGGGAYDAAYDRDGADDRGIVAGFLYRTDRLSLVTPDAGDPVLGSDPGVEYRAPGLPGNADVQNPKALNADLPDDVDTSTGTDGSNVYTRAPQVARFRAQAEPGRADAYDLWAISNHFSSGPDGRVGQRTEQAAYGAAIVEAIEAGDADARVVYGGDLNVFPRPDDPFAPGDPLFNSDQLVALYETGLHNLWDDLAADVPGAAYSYVFQGQGQTLDHLFANGALYDDLIEMRAAHVNAGWPADHPGDGSRGLSDHDPQIARFQSRAALTVSDVSVLEGDRGRTPATFTVQLSRPSTAPRTICAATVDLTARRQQDYDAFLGCRVIAAGDTEATITVQVRGDRKREPHEHFALLVGALGVRLTDPIGIGTIRNDD